ncbi:MAG: peptidylprolyl isomerase [SAR324 cluster bacterium]|uniref:Peptidyl-prolyl cis-trans isomerase n=1 Tax=SAR324 cluster bacterium TaxID=2024889 RepID=A0A7X9ILD7_9DELT|nr:peptidylprolyl isomerase [SAR324 cluster bacterium]
MRNITWLVFALFSLISITAPASLAVDVPFILPSRSELLKLKTAALFTSRGRIRFELFPEEAPWHVANFKYLADKGFYRDRQFHLFLPDYIIQTGLPKISEKQLFGYTLPPEFSQRQHQPGSLGMARLPDNKNAERRSSGTQFHILLDYNHKMDGSYTIFGQLIEGMDVLKELRKGDIIQDLKVYVRD